MIEVEIATVYRARAVDPDTASALVVVTGVDDATQSVAVTLLSPDLEFGSSTDLVVSGARIGRSYDLLAQSDIFGYVQAAQLDRRIGHVGRDLCEALGAPTRSSSRRWPDRRYCGDDPRWAFTLRALARLQRLTCPPAGAGSDDDPARAA